MKEENKSAQQANLEGEKIDPYHMQMLIVDRAHKEIAEVRTVYKWLAGSITIIIIVAASVVAFFGLNSIRDLKSELNENSQHFNKQLQQEYKDRIEQLQKDVKDLVGQQFKKDEITELVNKKLNEVAAQLIKDDITNRISPLKDDLTQLIKRTNDEAQQKIDQSRKAEKELQEAQANVQHSLEKVEMYLDFMKKVILAQSDDRSAYANLCNYQEDNLRNIGGRVQETIGLGYNCPDSGRQIKGYVVYYNHNNFNKASIGELKEIWKSVSPNGAVSFLVTCIEGNSNIKDDDKYKFYYDVLGDSKGSLMAADIAAKKLSTFLNAKYPHFLDFSDIKRCWIEKNNANKPAKP